MDYQWKDVPVYFLQPDRGGAQAAVARAGVIPFYGDEMLFMTPRRKPGSSAPKDQIAKGGRWVRREGIWQELGDRNAAALAGPELEPLLDTAMREGREELGLLPGNVECLYDIGPVEFLSEKTKAPAWMYLFAAKVKAKERFEDVLAQERPPVARVRWLTLEAFLREGREDHRPIVQAVWEKLRHVIPA